MDRENPFRAGYPMSNPSANPNSPAAEDDSNENQFLAYAAAVTAAEGRSNTPRYTTDVYNNTPRNTASDYNTPLVYEHHLASELARLTLDQSTPPLFPLEILQQLRIQSAARPQNYQNFEFDNYTRYMDGLQFNAGANLYNSVPLNGDAARRLNGNALNFYNSLRVNGGDSLNYGSPQRQRFNGLLNGDTRNSQYDALGRQNEILRQNEIGMNLNRNSVGRLNSVPVTRPRQQQQRTNLVPLHEMRGKIVTVAKDQFGCRFLQNKFAEGKPEEIQMIFMEIKDHIHELMVHQFGNYLISKFVEVCNQEQMSQLLMLVVNDDRKFEDICADMYGTRVVQKLLEHLTTQEQRCRVISVLRRITVSLTKTMNGHHVLQYCLKFFSIEDNKHILNVVADNCLDIATDKSGCCVLQQCLEHALGEPRQRLIAKLTSNALQLSHHPFGNYVVQYILGLNIGYATGDILRELSGNFVFLCMDKYGSNVVEKCLREAEDNQKIPIIEEIIYSPNFLEVLQDPYGNYVAQRALNTCKGALLHALIEMINRNSPNLHSHPHGKRVLEKTTKNYKQTFG